MKTFQSIRHVVLLILTVLLSCASAHSASYVFQTGAGVPLSLFQNYPGGSEVVLDVKPEILTYAQSHGFSLAIFRDGNYLGAPTSVDTALGKVRYTTGTSGKYVVVMATGWQNADVVNHWDPALNSGHGGFSQGAADMTGHLGTLGIDLNQEVVTKAFGYTQMPPPSGDQYVYNQSKYSFGSTGAQIPDFEHYCAEKWSTYTVQRELALWFSEQMIKQTGFPVIFSNWPAATPLSDIPAWQMISARVIEANSGKGSLATYILPPHWTASPAIRYPIVCMGYYDLHQAVFMDGGLEMLKLVGRAYTEGGRSAVTMLWNGGGATGGTRTFQRSAYDNAALMFNIAATEYGADQNSIITLGGSRGGISALMMAGNPYSSSYKVKYAIAMVSPAGAADMLDVGYNTTYPALFFISSQEDVGYWEAWKQSWSHPVTTRNGKDSLAYNLFGTTNLTTIRGLSPYSDASINVLLSNGTKLYLLNTSHDPFTPAFPAVDFYRRATAAGVPVEQHVYYGMGHNSSGLFDRLEDALMAVFGWGTFVTPSQHHYVNTDASGFREISNFPAAFEGARECVRGIPFALNVLGRAGMEYRIDVVKINDAQWTGSGQVVRTGTPVTATTGTIPAGGFYANASVAVPTNWATGYYEYDFYYKLAGQLSWQQMPESNISVPYTTQPTLRKPVFQVKALENDLYFECTPLGYPGIYANLGFYMTQRMAPSFIGFGMIGEPVP